MKKTQTLFIFAGLAIALTGVGIHYAQRRAAGQAVADYDFPTTKFGAYLAAQHAMYVNDFDRAVEFTRVLDGADPVLVQNTKMLAEFLSGVMPENVKILKSEKSPAARLIYDTYLVKNDRWDELYQRHKADNTTIMAPLRIWASVATNHKTAALKFIDKLQTNASWKAFVRGQIYAQLGDTAAATDEFKKVHTEFMNVNDYLYLMSFYTAHGNTAAADALASDFTARPGGLYMLNHREIPAWEMYQGLRNQLAYGLIQNVSHTQIMMYSDLSLMLLRMAEFAQTGDARNQDAINYYMGQYFYNNTGDCAPYYTQISKTSPLRAFADMRLAEAKDDFAAIDQIVAENPLFVPGIIKMVGHHVRQGQQRAAIGVINRALAHPDLNEIGRGFFLKARAQVRYAFGDYEDAQKDIDDAVVILPGDAEIWGIQAKIWAAQKRNLDKAYDYAMNLVRRNAADVTSWDVLGRVVAARDGTDVALDLLVRVGEVSSTCSSLFDVLGDLHAAAGHIEDARAAYGRAIDLSDDGLIVVPYVEKKLRKLK